MSRYSSLSLALSFALSASPALAIERPDYVGTR